MNGFVQVVLQSGQPRYVRPEFVVMISESCGGTYYDDESRVIPVATRVLYLMGGCEIRIRDTPENMSALLA